MRHVVMILEVIEQRLYYHILLHLKIRLAHGLINLSIITTRMSARGHQGVSQGLASCHTKETVKFRKFTDNGQRKVKHLNSGHHGVS